MNTNKCLEKLNYDPLPLELKETLINFALEVHKKEIGLSVLANVIPTERGEQSNLKTDKNVFVYTLVPALTKIIQDKYPIFSTNHPTLSSSPGRGAVVQVINGPFEGEEYNNIYPHKDPTIRPRTLMYILSPGGSRVKTTWYKIKGTEMEYKEYAARQQVAMYDVAGYSIDEVEPIEEHIMEENGWYIFNHGIIHGVTNIESPRIILSFMLDYVDISERILAMTGPRDIQKLRNDWSNLDSLK